jgi:hypothetical protein
MSGLFKKLNTLVNAKINSAMSDAGEGARRRLGRQSNPNMDKQVKKLRNQVDKAMVREDELQANVATLLDEVTRLDQQADNAVRTGDDDSARRLISQLQRAQQRLEMAEADLRQHQLVAEELIYQVNMLEASVDAARQADASSTKKKNVPAQPGTDSVEGQKEENIVEIAQRKIDDLANLMGEKKDQLAAVIQQEPPQPAQSESITPQPQTTEKKPYEDAIKEAKVQDDLDSRRRRLSKK